MFPHRPLGFRGGSANTPEHRPRRHRSPQATSLNFPVGRKSPEYADPAIRHPAPDLPDSPVRINATDHGALGAVAYSANANAAFSYQNTGGSSTHISPRQGPGRIQPTVLRTLPYQQPQVGSTTSYWGQPFGYQLDGGGHEDGNVESVRQMSNGCSQYLTQQLPWNDCAYGHDDNLCGCGDFESQRTDTFSYLVGHVPWVSHEVSHRNQIHVDSDSVLDIRTRVNNLSVRNRDGVNTSIATNGATTRSWDTESSTTPLGECGPNSQSSSPSSGSCASQDRVSCADCGRSYSGEYRKGNLARHRRQKHGNAEQSYPCEEPYCLQKFKRQDARLKHYRKNHPGRTLHPPLPRKSGFS